MFKSLLWLIGVCVVLAALVMGPAVVSHLRAARDVVRDGVESAMPDVQKTARIRILLKEMDSTMLSYQDIVADTEDRAARERAAADRTEKEVEAQKGILRKAKEVLDEGGNQFQIAGKVYTREQVARDAMARMNCCERLMKDLSARRDAVQKLDAAVAMGRANLEKAKDAKRQKLAELEQLEARLANAGMLQQVNELTAKLRESPLAPDTELGRAFTAFEKHVRQQERRADFIAGEANGGAIVDWQGSPDTSGEVKLALDRFLGQQATR